MLHRLTLRVLPRLSLAVTQEEVRKRKRLVMVAPGLVAFAVYRAFGLLGPLSEPIVLLVLSGLLSAATALWAYRLGRETSLMSVWREDGAWRLGWLAGWIGFAYGVQLSLMVLALLKVLANYDFLRHPEGPAMMALIIACTSVARDAFEIGHIRRLQRQGKPVLTFPDGAALRRLLREQPGPLARWAVLSAAGCALVAVGVARLGVGIKAELDQLVAVSLMTGGLAVWAYLAGEQRSGRSGALLATVRWSDLFRFWWWPGLAFAATYYLVLVGGVWFLLRADSTGGAVQGLLAGLVGGMMALYCYYLGYRRYVEDQVQQIVPASLLRCPFVMGILSKSRPNPERDVIPQTAIPVGEPGRQG